MASVHTILAPGEPVNTKSPFATGGVGGRTRRISLRGPAPSLIKAIGPVRVPGPPPNSPATTLDISPRSRPKTKQESERGHDHVGESGDQSTDSRWRGAGLVIQTDIRHQSGDKSDGGKNSSSSTTSSKWPKRSDSMNTPLTASSKAHFLASTQKEVFGRAEAPRPPPLVQGAQRQPQPSRTTAGWREAQPWQQGPPLRRQGSQPTPRKSLSPLDTDTDSDEDELQLPQCYDHPPTRDPQETVQAVRLSIYYSISRKSSCSSATSPANPQSSVPSISPGNLYQNDGWAYGPDQGRAGLLPVNSPRIGNGQNGEGTQRAGTITQECSGYMVQDDWIGHHRESPLQSDAVYQDTAINQTRYLEPAYPPSCRFQQNALYTPPGHQPAHEAAGVSNGYVNWALDSDGARGMSAPADYSEEYANDRSCVSECSVLGSRDEPGLHPVTYEDGPAEQPQRVMTPSPPASHMSSNGGGEAVLGGARGVVPGMPARPAPGGRDEPPSLSDLYNRKAIAYHEEDRLDLAQEYFRRAAEIGSATGCLMCGMSYRHGWGCKVDLSLSFEYLARAAEVAAGELRSTGPDLLPVLAEGLGKMRGVSRRKPAGCLKDGSALERKAVGGDQAKGLPLLPGRSGVEAKRELSLILFEIAQSCRHGWGVPQAKTTCCFYLELSAHLGEVDAQVDAAVCYLRGEGVKRDKMMSARYFRMAENQGGVVLPGNTWIWKHKYDRCGVFKGVCS